MKVVIIMPVAEQRGGAEQTLRHLLQYTLETNIQWIVVFLEDGPMVAQARQLGIEVRVVRAGRLREPHRFLRCVLRIGVLARRMGAEAILSWMPKAHLYGSAAALLAGLPSLWFQHNVRSEPVLLDHIITGLPASGILACSKTAAQAQARLRPSLSIRVVYPGVELEQFDPAALPAPAEARRLLDLPVDGPLIGIVGRLQHSKGMHVLVEAMPRVLQSHPNAHCVIVGGRHDLEPDYPAYLQQKITELNLDGRVTVAGLQTNIPHWMQAMDVVVNATDVEGFGIVIIEAMALGKPVIAGDAGGPTEIITDGMDGLLSPYGAAEALARSVLRYLDDPEFARRVGDAARERAADFSAQHYAQSCITAIHQLLDGSH